MKSDSKEMDFFTNLHIRSVCGHEDAFLELENLSRNQEREDLKVLSLGYIMFLSYPTGIPYKGGKNYRKAISIAETISQPLQFRHRANLLSAHHSLLLGVMYLYGIGVDRDYMQAYRLLEASASEGNSDALAVLGNCLFSGKISGIQDYSKAIEYATLSSNQGNPIAQADLGRWYLEGIGVTKNLPEGLRLVSLSAEQGYPVGHFLLGECYHYGLGVNTNLEKSVQLYHLSACSGYAGAQGRYADCVFHGIGAEQNVDDAIRFYTMAADQGDVGAQTNLGIYYLATDNYQESFKYLVLASFENNSLAQRALGHCYELGVGVRGNISEAIRLYTLSAKQGDKESQQKLEKLLKDYPTKTM